jgi:hypothetical protein
MESVEPTAAIYSEAKSEYTEQLIGNFQPVLLRFFLDRFKEVKGTAKSKPALSEFQDSLSQIPEWNLDKVQRETTKLLAAINCDYLEDLITAVFIAHTKILSAIRLQAKPRRRINITVPKPDHFMHRALSESSRLLWANVYLFNDSVSSLDQQKNMNEVNRLLEKGILQAIRNLLPVKSILRESLQEEDDEDGVGINATPAQEEEETPAPVASAPLEESSLPPAEVKEIIAPPEQSSVVTKLEEIAPVALIAPPPTPVQLDMSGIAAASPVPLTPTIAKAAQTFVVDTERSVAFTGMDTVFGEGVAEVKPTTEEGDDEFHISDEAVEFDMDEIEDLDAPPPAPEPLNADDFESL